MALNTLGRQLLLAVLQRTSSSAVAARCRVSLAAVSKWAAGKSRPALDAQVQLESSYRIPRSAWNVGQVGRAANNDLNRR